MKITVITLILLSFAILACANPYLVCDPQTGVDYYELSFDSNTPIQVQSDGVYGIKYDLGSMQDGTHNVEAKACNMWGCSEPVSFGFLVHHCGIPQNINIKKIK